MRALRLTQVNLEDSKCCSACSQSTTCTRYLLIFGGRALRSPLPRLYEGLVFFVVDASRETAANSAEIAIVYVYFSISFIIGQPIGCPR